MVWSVGPFRPESQSMFVVASLLALAIQTAPSAADPGAIA